MPYSNLQMPLRVVIATNDGRHGKVIAWLKGRGNIDATYTFTNGEGDVTNDNTLLMHAAEAGHEPVVDVLIQHWYRTGVWEPEEFLSHRCEELALTRDFVECPAHWNCLACHGLLEHYREEKDAFYCVEEMNGQVAFFLNWLQQFTVEDDEQQLIENEDVLG